MAGEIDRLVADPFHQAAVAGDDIGAMVDDRLAETGVGEALGDRHADGCRQPLAERAGRRLDAGRVLILRMPRRHGAELTKVLEVLDLDPGIADEITERIEQHRAVAGRKHEAVAVGPTRIGGVEFQEGAKKHARDIGHAHRHAGMAGLGPVHGVHRQGANGVGVVPRARGGNIQHLNFLYQAPFWRCTSARMRGVRMSCIARSSLLPGMTIELARDIQLPAIIVTR